MTEANKPTKPKKRVRFSDSHEIREYQPDTEDTSLDLKRTKVVGDHDQHTQDPMEVLEGEIGAVCLSKEPHHIIDPATAAARRAHLRREHIMAAFEAEDDDDYLDWDLPHAAEEYNENNNDEVRFNEQGIPIEPFNMREEREQGYFDEETGEYIEWKRDVEPDAWIDELPNAPVDASWLKTLHTRHDTTGTTTDNNTQFQDLSKQQVEQLKSALISMLQPEETVLDALRRLGHSRTKTTATHMDDSSSSASRAVLAKLPAMPVAIKEEFDRITEVSSRLMEAGEYGIHTTPREVLMQSLLRHDNTITDNNGSEPVEAAMNASGVSGQKLAAKLLSQANEAEEDGHYQQQQQHVQQQQQPVDTTTDMFADDEVQIDNGNNNYYNNGVHSAQLFNGIGGGTLDGFVVDGSSGFLYNSNMKAYFDPTSGLFGDASTGKWYRYQGGEYVLVE